MTRVRLSAALAAMTCILAPAMASADDVQTLRQELQELRRSYDERVRALEARVDELETAASAAESAVAAGVAAAPTQLPAQPTPQGREPDTRMMSATRSASAFNPAISLILGGSYTNTSEDPGTYTLAGFIPSGGEVGPGERSFNLGESEITLAASVDPYFSAQLTAALTPEDEIEVEEAFFRATALPEGFTARGGRFFSGIGYLNEVHAHAWDFTDQPLVYQAFFGRQLVHDGLQVKWLAPTDLFIELGVEAGNGEAFPGTRRNRNGLNGATLFGHVGGDVGDSISWRAGASWIDLRAEDRGYEDLDDGGNAVMNAFSGKSRTWGLDAVLKWTPADNTRRQLKVQGEYLHRKETGDLLFDAEGAALVDSFRSEQRGWYVQSVWQFNPRWRAGARYDALDSGDPRIGLVEDGTLPIEAFPALLPADPDRLSLMIDWNPSEFSRLRAQYAWDDSRGAGDRDRQFRLQYLFGIGAHGAHKY
jgi:hypothetical protein